MEHIIRDLIQAQHGLLSTQQQSAAASRHLQDQLLMQLAMLQALMESHPDQAALKAALRRIHQADPALRQAMERAKSPGTPPSAA